MLQEQIQNLKDYHRPINKEFIEKPHERNPDEFNRVCTRPWDNCWFSNKPHIISLTLEEALQKHPDYILWCYNNLTKIKWSVYSIRLIEETKQKRTNFNNLFTLNKNL